MPRNVNIDDVAATYRHLLGRDPDASGVDSFVGKVTTSELLDYVGGSLEARIHNQNLIGTRYYQYNASLDAVGILLSHEDLDRKPVPNRLVNFLGVIIDPAYLPHILGGREGQIEGAPIPANWHADLAEFAAALRAVDLSTGSFRMVELGCGWGCWLLITGVAARRRGLTVDLIGAEADEGHVAFAQQGCRENGFGEDQARIMRRIVGPNPGTALFPKQSISGIEWGLEPIFSATEEQIRLAATGDHYDILPILTFEEICADGRPVDLVHMDIQGGEADFLDACILQMNERVAYLVVGTHSRQIEGRIYDIMLANGWRLEIDRAALFNLSMSPPQTTVDGVQGWRNPRLRPL